MFSVDTLCITKFSSNLELALKPMLAKRMLAEISYTETTAGAVWAITPLYEGRMDVFCDCEGERAESYWYPGGIEFNVTYSSARRKFTLDVISTHPHFRFSITPAREFGPKEIQSLVNHIVQNF